MLKYIFLIVLGLSGGIAVGTAIASFLTLLDVIPRLAQVSDSNNQLGIYQKVIVISVITTTLIEFFKISLYGNIIFLIPIGILVGAFIGLLASALAEVLNVIPVLENKLNLKEFLKIPVLAISLGKVVGSLIDWLILNNIK